MAAPRGIQRTLRTLQGCANPSATDTLVAALDAAAPDIRIGAVRAIALRPDLRGHDALAGRFESLTPDEQDELVACPQRATMRSTMGRLVTARRGAAARQVVELAVRLGEVTALPAVVEVACSPDHPAGAAAATATLDLAKLLWHRLERRDPELPDPAFVRRPAVNALAKGVDQFAKHRRVEIIEAMLYLSPHDEPTLVRAMRDKSHPASGAIRDALRAATGEGVTALLAAILRDTTSADDLLMIATQRSDLAGLEGLHSRLGWPLGVRVAMNAARIGALPWLAEQRRDVVLSLSPVAQASAIEFAAATQSPRDAVAAAIGLVLERGTDIGRTAAAKALATVPARLAAAPLMKAIDDPLAGVARAAAALLRSKDVPDATRILIGKLDDSDESVRRAAQRSLSELSYATYRDHYHDLSPDERRRAGALVAKADPLALASLKAELTAGAVDRRLRGLELVEAMGVAEPLWQALLARLDDRDAAVRAEASRLLGEVPPRDAVIAALAQRARDRSSAVRSAAASALERLRPAERPLASLRGRT
jgi:HEAT repeat protein